VQHCNSDPTFSGNCAPLAVLDIICFGHPGKELDTIGIPVVSLGHLSSDDLIRTAYFRRPIFMFYRSLEDNLPNTILESLSCGTPIVAFEVWRNTGCRHRRSNRQTRTAYDTNKMAKAIISLIANPTQREEMGRRGRPNDSEGIFAQKQAQNYLSLYKELRERKLTRRISTRSAEPIGQVRLETALGPAFQAIYDDVLFSHLRNTRQFCTSMAGKVKLIVRPGLRRSTKP